MENIQDIDIKRLELNKGQVEGLPKNPRFIRDERYKALVKSIEDAPEMLKLRELLVVEHGSKFVVIGGNMRLRACKELGMETVPCKVLPADTPVAKLREYAIKDNNGFGEDDWDILANEWDAEELQEWGMELPMDWDVDGEGDVTATEDDFDESEVTEAVCKRGEVWKLGEHRLMCGDSTNADDIDKLIDGDFIRLVVTSPPYGVGKDYEEQGVGPWLVTIKGVINAIKGKALIICWNIVDLFCTGTQFTEPTGAYSIEMMSAAGYGMLYNRIWKKPGGNFAGNNPYYTVTTKPVQDYEYLYAFAEKNADRHIEPIKKYLFGEAKKASLTNDIISNAGGPAFMYGHWFTNHQWSLIDEKNYKLLQEYCISQGIDAFKREYCSLHDEYLRKTIYSKNLPKEEFSEWGLYGVWEFNTVHERLGGHAAAFPIELPVRYIKMHSYEGDTVLDPFGGTGTTLIAAEQLNRKCRMMELDPHYCDVIIARWEKLTGQKAERISDG